MEQYIWVFIIIGGMGLALPWLTNLFKDKPLNIPIVAVILGVVLYSLPIDLPDPNPIRHSEYILRLTELAVIISLMGTGLKLNRSFSFKNYKVPLLLVFVTMVGCIAGTAAFGWWFMGLVPASALLLGAAAAPTDPVIAEDVQVAFEESEEEEHPVRFSLTAEAGMNDGMAFPFTWLAIWAATEGVQELDWLGNWALIDVLYRIAIGVAIGFGTGRFIAWLFFKLPKKQSLEPKRMAFVALAATIFVYGITEMLFGYGFIAVFVAAVAIRQYERDHDFHKSMHNVIEQMEKFFVSIILILLGGYAVHYLFDALTIEGALLTLAFILVIRPLSGVIPTLGTRMNWRSRWIIAFMGIKGVGSFFYLAFGIDEIYFPQTAELWATMAFLVLVSVFVHGISGFFIKPYMKVDMGKKE